MALKSLGKITVASHGTPVRVTTNQSSPSARYAVQSLSVFAPSGNTGNVYIGIGSSFDRSAYTGLLGIIAKGTWWSSVVNLAPAALNAADYYIDADNDNDVALVVATEQ